MRGLEEELALVEAEISQLEGLLSQDLYKVEEPLYLQPSDLPSFHEQNTKHALFEPRLKAHLMSTFAAKHKQDQLNRQVYRKQYDTWQEGITRIEVENGEKHLFEEDAPKHNHTVSLLQQTHSSTTTTLMGGSRSRSRSAQALGGNGDVVRSEEELNQVLLSLIEAERENPATRWMSTLALIPPMIAADPAAVFLDENTLISGCDLVMPTVERMTEDGRAWSCVWTEDEERIFVEKYLAYPKNFAKIATFLDKHRGDCVQFYYRNKKRLKLKQRLQSHRRNPPQNDAVPVKKKVGRPPRAQSLFVQPPTINEEDELMSN